jgi:hypothetical protein
MSVVVRFPQPLTTEQYEQVKARVSEGGGFPRMAWSTTSASGLRATDA